MNKLLDAIDSLVMVFDESGLQYVNAKFRAALGYTPATLYELIYVDDHEFIAHNYLYRPYHLPSLRLKRHDGTLLNVNLTVSLMDEGIRNTWIGTASLNHPQVNLDSELKALYEQYRTFVDLLSSDTCVFTVDKNRIYMDSASQKTFKHLTGIDWQELSGMASDEILSQLAPDHTLLKKDLQDIWNGKITDSVYQFPTPQGGNRWMHIRRVPVFDETRQTVLRYYSVLQDITERREADEALRASEERYRITSELISDFAFSFKVQADGSTAQEWLTVDSFQRITGYTPEESIHQNSRTLYHPDDMERARQDIATTLKGESTRGEYRILTRNGEVRHIVLHRSPVMDENQNVIRFYGAARDITEYKQTEEALRASEERYRITSELISDYAYCISIEPSGLHQIEWITEDSFQRMTGYEPIIGEFIPQFNIIHELERERTRQDVAAVIAGQTMRGEYRIITRKGEERTLYFHRHPILNEETGEVLRYYGVTQDITERKRAEKALQESEERYRTLVQNFPNGFVALFDHDMRYVLAGGDGLKIFDVSPEMLIGKTLFEVHSQDFIKRDVAYIKAALEGKHSVIEISYKERLLEVHTLPIRDDSGGITGCMVMAQDITHRLKMRESEQLQKELKILLHKEQDISRLKNRLMEVITHEFRTPLAVISTSIGMLERHMQSMTEEKRNARMRQVYHQINHLTEMLDDMAVVVRGEVQGISFKPAVLDMVALCQDIVEIIGATLGVEHRLEFVTPLSEFNMRVDSSLIQRILRNLLSNAIKYSPPTTRIEISLRESGNLLELSVADEGHGIADEEQRHIFEPFFRSEKVQTIPGLGLGLGIVQDAVHMHHGHIKLESAQGKGTRFIVMLPVVQDIPAVKRQ